jgi:hypothetical protein
MSCHPHPVSIRDHRGSLLHGHTTSVLHRRQIVTSTIPTKRVKRSFIGTQGERGGVMRLATYAKHEEDPELVGVASDTHHRSASLPCARPRQKHMVILPGRDAIGKMFAIVSLGNPHIRRRVIRLISSRALQRQPGPSRRRLRCGFQLLHRHPSASSAFFCPSAFGPFAWRAAPFETQSHRHGFRLAGGHAPDSSVLKCRFRRWRNQYSLLGVSDLFFNATDLYGQ